MSKKNYSFLKSFAIIGSSTFLNMVIGVLTTPIITRLVLPESYGQLSMFTLYTNMATVVLCLGLDQALVRFYYDCEGTEYRITLLRKCIRFPLVIALGMCTLLFGLYFGRRILQGFSISVTGLLCVNIIVHLIYRFSLLVVRLEKKSKVYGLLNIVHKLSYVCCALALLVLTEADDFLLLAIATVASGIICVVASIFNQKEYWFHKRTYTEKIVSQRELIKYGYPFIFSMGVTTLFQAADKMALNAYCPYSVVGVYASAMSLVHIFAIVQTTFNTLWGPIALEHYSRDPENTTVYVQANKIITVIMFFLGITLILCKDVFAILLGEKYREAAYILPFLIFNPIMYTISETTCLGIVFKKKSKMQVIVVLIPCLTNVLGNSVLVPCLGGIGAAMSTGLSYIVFFFMRTLISQRYFPVNYELKPFLIVTLIVSAYALYNTFYRINIVSIIGYLICIGVILLLYWDTVTWCLNYVKDFFEDFRKKGYAILHRKKHD